MHCFVSPAKRLRERATVLRYMYIACLILFHQISVKMTEWSQNMFLEVMWQVKKKGEGKVIPLQARCGPEGG